MSRGEELKFTLGSLFVSLSFLKEAIDHFQNNMEASILERIEFQLNTCISQMEFLKKEAVYHFDLSYDALVFHSFEEAALSLRMKLQDLKENREIYQ